MKKETCPRCGIAFSCGADDPGSPCACLCLPPVFPVEGATRCLCPDCLARAIDGKIREALEEVKTQADLEPLLTKAAPYAGSPSVKHLDFESIDGRHVFLPWSHLRRGTCCGNGCLHCPWNSLAP